MHPYNPKQTTRFKIARFHAASGPASLFERVRFKMNKPKELKLNAEHFQDRVFERNVPVEQIKTFDPNLWELKTVEVRTDTGKFVSCAWEVQVNDRNWWVVIGLQDTIKTVIHTKIGKGGRGEDIVTSGELYEFVERVNQQLMDSEHNVRDNPA